MAQSPRSQAFIPRLRLALFALGAITGLPACVTREAEPVQKPALTESMSGEAVVHQRDAVSLEGWQAETFALPPGFAPNLPAGTESLRFAPGWRDPSAVGFWSYAFVMWIDEAAPDAAHIEDLLKRYYNGLMTAFAAGKDISSTPAQVDVVRNAHTDDDPPNRLGSEE